MLIKRAFVIVLDAFFCKSELMAEVQYREVQGHESAKHVTPARR